MPKQKDLKRLVRSRMQKTGESYTAARLYIVRKEEPAPNYAELAGMSDAAIKKATGREWREWVRTLDAANSTSKPHREIAQYVSSLGVGDWWTQSVTVGYERIKGLREKGQRRGGGYEANKSRTYPVPMRKLVSAFSSARTRKRWLPVDADVRAAASGKAMRMKFDDGTVVQVGFIAKGDAKSAVAIQHQKLPDKSTAERLKTWWSERFDALADVLS